MTESSPINQPGNTGNSSPGFLPGEHLLWCEVQASKKIYIVSQEIGELSGQWEVGVGGLYTLSLEQ